jgi:hypothetical protein
VYEHLGGDDPLGDLVIGVVPCGFDRASHGDHPALGREGREPVDLLHVLPRSYRETPEHDRRGLLEDFRLSDFARKIVGVGASASAPGSR